MNEVPGRDQEDCQCTWHKVGSSRLVTGSHSSLECDLLEQAMCSAQQYVCLLLSIERHKQKIEPFRQGGMGECAFF
jgi:hypothetical protein